MKGLGETGLEVTVLSFECIRQKISHTLKSNGALPETTTVCIREVSLEARDAESSGEIGDKPAKRPRRPHIGEALA